MCQDKGGGRQLKGSYIKGFQKISKITKENIHNGVQLVKLLEKDLLLY